MNSRHCVIGAYVGAALLLSACGGSASGPAAPASTSASTSPGAPGQAPGASSGAIDPSLVRTADPAVSGSVGIDSGAATAPPPSSTSGAPSAPSASGGPSAPSVSGGPSAPSASGASSVPSVSGASSVARASGGPSVARAHDACSLASAGDITAAFGGKVPAGGHATGGDLCTWYIVGGSVGPDCIVRVMLPGFPKDKAGFEENKAQGSAPATVPGVGDDAYHPVEGDPSLQFRKGDSIAEVDLNCSSIPDLGKQSAAVVLAKSVVAKL